MRRVRLIWACGLTGLVALVATTAQVALAAGHGREHRNGPNVPIIGRFHLTNQAAGTIKVHKTRQVDGKTVRNCERITTGSIDFIFPKAELRAGTVTGQLQIDYGAYPSINFSFRTSHGAFYNWISGKNPVVLTKNGGVSGSVRALLEPNTGAMNKPLSKATKPTYLKGSWHGCPSS